MRGLLKGLLWILVLGVGMTLVVSRFFVSPNFLPQQWKKVVRWASHHVGFSGLSLPAIPTEWMLLGLGLVILLIIVVYLLRAGSRVAPTTSKPSRMTSLEVFCWLHQWLGRVVFAGCLSYALYYIFYRTTRAPGWQFGNYSFSLMTFYWMFVTLVTGALVQHVYARIPNLFIAITDEYFYTVPHVGWESNLVGRCIGLFYNDPKFDYRRRVHTSEAVNLWFNLHLYGFVWAGVAFFVALAKLGLVIGVVYLAQHISAPRIFGGMLVILDWSSALISVVAGAWVVALMFKKLYDKDPLKNLSGIIVVPPVHMGLIDTLKTPVYTLFTGIRIMKTLVDQLNKNKEDAGYASKLVGDGLKPDKSKKIDSQGSLCGPFIPLNPVVYNFGIQKIELSTGGFDIFGFYDSTVLARQINGPRNRVYAPTSLADLMSQEDQLMQEAVIAVAKGEYRPGYKAPELSEKAKKLDIIERTSEISDYLTWLLQQVYDQRKLLPGVLPSDIPKDVKKEDFYRYFERNSSSVRHNDGFQVEKAIINDITPPELIDRKRSERRAAQIDTEIGTLQGEAEENRLKGVARGIELLKGKGMSANVAGIARALEGIFAGRNETARVVAERQFPARPSRSTTAEGESNETDGDE